MPGRVLAVPGWGVIVGLAGLLAAGSGGMAWAGGACVTSTDCNLSPNFCLPGFCDIFGQCQYQHNDGVCRVPPFGDNLYCNGNSICNESLNGGNGGCITIPVNCQSPTPFCNETLDSCVECTSNANCTTAPRLTCKTSTGTCVQCVSGAGCDDGVFCNGQEVCNQGTGLCGSGTPISCPTGQFCSNALQLCVECENTGNCDDGLYCNGSETCNKSTHTCVAGTSVACKSCNGGTTAGEPCLVNEDCGGGGTCTGPSTYCSDVTDSCVECLSNSHCNDGKFCTADTCIFNTCSNVADPLQFCDDHVFCNGAETCNASTGLCGGGTAPNCTKKCFRGLSPGAVCTTDASCGKSCDAGFRAGLTCTTDSNCTGVCVGGSGSGLQCTNASTCGGGICQTGICVPGLCRGGCSEQFDACVGCAPDVTGSTSCSDSLYCDGSETCNAQHQCAAGVRVNCSGLDDLPCGSGSCNETNDQCQRIATPGIPAGTPCDDGDICTRVDYCQNSFCVDNPPLTNDPYRCVRLELRPTTSQTVIVGGTVNLDLYAVANGCNTASSDCTSTQHPIQAITALLSWDSTRLQLKPSTSGDKNPLDPCDNANSCYVCSGVCSGGSRNNMACDNVTTLCPGGVCNPNPATYNWSGSLFPNDCQVDAVNEPCSGFPANDGTAWYTAVPQLACGGSPARLPCATSSGLYVTRFKFKALSVPPGGTTSVSLLPCFGEFSQTKASSGIQPPTGYISDDVTKAIGSPAPIKILSCATGADCSDSDPCTVDSCLGGVCRNDPLQCADVDECTIDTCVNGLCTHTPVSCGAGNRCYEGSCYKTCVTSANCDDNVACTINTCVPVSGDDICVYTPDDAQCATGLFCSAKVCDPVLGCVFDHECISGNGNPCVTAANCNDTADNCGGCFKPAAVPSGARSIQVTPSIAQGSTPVAIHIRGDCNDGDVSCVSMYLQPRCAGGTNDGQLCLSDADCPRTCNGTPNGTACTSDANCMGIGTCMGTCDKGMVGTTPTYMTASQWGTVFPHAAEIRPDSRYLVFSGCNFGGNTVLSEPDEVTTYVWGDTDGDGLVNFADVSGVVNAFKNVYSEFQTFQSTNVAGIGENVCGDPQSDCLGQSCINFTDVSYCVDAFKSIAYPCEATCP